MLITPHDDKEGMVLKPVVGLEVESVQFEHFGNSCYQEYVTEQTNSTDYARMSGQTGEISRYYSFSVSQMLSVVVLQANRRPNRTSYRLLKP